MTTNELTKVCIMAIDSGLGEFDIDSLLVGGKAVLTLREATLISNVVKAVNLVIENVKVSTVDYVYAKYINNTISAGLITDDAIRRNTVLTGVGSVKLITPEEAAPRVDEYIRSHDINGLFTYITSNYLFKEYNELTALLVCIQLLLNNDGTITTDGRLVHDAMDSVRSGGTIYIENVLQGQTNTDYIEFNGQKYLVSDVIKSVPSSVRNSFESDYECAKSVVAMYVVSNLGGVL